MADGVGVGGRAVVFVSVGVPSAAAGYEATASGQVQVDAQFVPPPAAPVATNVGADVTVSWGAVTSSGGLPVDGYLVERLDAGGAPVVIGAGCDGVVAATSCVETGVPAGTWTYRVRARFAGWTGPFRTGQRRDRDRGDLADDHRPRAPVRQCRPPSPAHSTGS
ncbi:MAG: hypothetical protein R2713_10365 [Ilumatobacteraceae bacterium]